MSIDNSSEGKVTTGIVGEKYFYIPAKGNYDWITNQRIIT